MKRRLFNLLTVLSPLLCAAVAATWVRSYFVQDDIGRAETVVLPSMDGVVIHHSLYAARGHLAWTRHQVHQLISLPEPKITEVRRAAPPSPYVYRRVSWSYERSQPGWTPTKTSLANHLGFGAGGQSLSRPSDTYHYAWIPCWFLFLLTALLPAVRLQRWQRHRRRFARRCCRRCGYDLRATPDRCPECGQVSGNSD